MSEPNFWGNTFPKLQKAAHEFLGRHTAETVPELKSRPKELLLAQDGSLEIFYSPFNLNSDLSALSASRIFLVGITPGSKQGNLAIRNYINDKNSKADDLRQANRKSASFAGSTRTLLIGMLNGIGIPSALGITSAIQLFGESAKLMNCTSLLQYPVLKNGKDYSGHSPTIDKSPLLNEMAKAFFVPKMLATSSQTLVVPLGTAVSNYFKSVVKENPHLENQILWDFPHPSGGNRSRAKMYAENQMEMKKKVKAFYS